MESVFESKEHYLEFITEWKKRASDPKLRKSLTLSNYIIYAALRRKDWTKCLSPSSTEQTLLLAKHALYKATRLRLECFGNTVTQEMIEKMRENLSND